MHSITGAGTIEIGGESRPIVIDIAACDALYELVGEHFELWLIEKCTKRDEATKGLVRRVPEPSARTLIAFAASATYREESGVKETLQGFRKKLHTGELAALSAPVLDAVMASFGAPGNAQEGVVSEGGTLESPLAPTHGTGTAS